MFKQKRLEQAETVCKYEQCEMIHSEIEEVRAKKRSLEQELAVFQKKEKKAKWHQRRKLAGHTKRGAKRKLCASDESDTTLSPPRLSSSPSTSRSRSLSEEPAIVQDEIVVLQDSDEVLTVEGSELAHKQVPFEIEEVVQENIPVFRVGLPASQESLM